MKRPKGRLRGGGYGDRTQRIAPHQVRGNENIMMSTRRVGMPRIKCGVTMGMAVSLVGTAAFKAVCRAERSWLGSIPRHSRSSRLMIAGSSPHHRPIFLVIALVGDYPSEADKAC